MEPDLFGGGGTFQLRKSPLQTFGKLKGHGSDGECICIFKSFGDLGENSKLLDIHRLTRKEEEEEERGRRRRRRKEGE